MRSIDTINGMQQAEFVSTFGDVAEHSPWVAERAFGARPFASRDELIEAFCRAVSVADPSLQLALLRAHPDLAGKAALAKQLTADSSREQKGAGLDTLDATEFATFQDLNGRYRHRFGFPFIFAVKGATKHQILAAFGERIDNPPEAELETALDQVGRIFRFRIEERVEAT